MFRFFVLSLSLLALCLQAAPNPAANGKAPRLVLGGSPIHELGKIHGYGKQTVSFRIRNTGDGAGEIFRLVPSCSCVTATVDKNQLQPQEEAVVTAVLEASLVHGVFKRGLWVETSDPSQPRIYLALHGEVLPLVSDLPTSNQQLILAEGASLTNRFTLSQAETNIFLGKPLISTDTNALLAAATVATHTQGKTTFEVTLVVTARTSGTFPLNLTIPIEGRPNLRPIRLTYYVRAGSELRVIPSRILLTPDDRPQTRRIHLMGMHLNMATNALTWTPPRDGVSVEVSASSNNTALLTVTLTLSPEAVTNLMKEANAQLTFNYPHYKSASIGFFSQPQPPTGKSGIAH